MKDWKTLLLSTARLRVFSYLFPILERSTGLGRVDTSSYMDFVSMFLRIMSLKESCIKALVDMLELGTTSCFPILGSEEVFMFRWSIVATREERSRVLLVLTFFAKLLFFEEDEPDLFLFGGVVFFRAILSQRWRWPRMRSSCEYAVRKK